VDLIYGVHSTYECLKSGSRPVERIYCSQGASSRHLQEILDLARARGIPVKFEPREILDRKTGYAAHQGVVAVCGVQPYVALEDLLVGLSTLPLLVFLDSIVDPRNLGAILRTCAVYGVDGVVIPKDNAAGLSPTVSKAAEGALAHLHIARVTNLVRAIQYAQERGIWMVGIESDQPKSCVEVEYSVPIGLVFGNEGTGLRRLVRENCDILASIPTLGPLHSLNVSVAAGIVLFEVARSRGQGSNRHGHKRN